MSWFSKLLNKILPEDTEEGCGYGPFKLSEKHPFTPACRVHDWEFGEAHNGNPDKPLAQVDWDLFYRWVLIAKAQPTPELRCALALEICKNWPLARGFGGFLWDGDPKKLARVNLGELVSSTENTSMA